MAPKSINLKIATLNVQSLNTGRDELVRTVNNTKPDILTITESRLNEMSLIKNYFLDGYRMIHKPRGTGKRREGGGIGFYINKNFILIKFTN